MSAVRVAKWFMKLCEQRPIPPDREVGDLAEVFQHPSFLAGGEADRKSIMFRSSRAKYEREMDDPWDLYFGIPLRPWLEEMRVLDLGCFTGGRSAAWAERYECAEMIGVDVALEYIQAATQFADARGVGARFAVAHGERLPFRDDEFDAVLSCDVFEHLESVERVLAECHRILKEGGRLLVAFPGFYHPFEHHLALVTRFPGIHYVFRPETVVRAYYEIVEERGEEARWYRRDVPTLRHWERGHTINGTTARQFRRLVNSMDWVIRHEQRMPIGRTLGRRALFRPVYWLAWILAVIPLVDEFVLNRVTYILEKQSGRRARRGRPCRSVT